MHCVCEFYACWCSHYLKVGAMLSFKKLGGRGVERYQPYILKCVNADFYYKVIATSGDLENQ